MIFLTYTGYTKDGFSENLWLIALEYFLVLVFLAYELWKNSLVRKVGHGKTI